MSVGELRSAIKEFKKTAPKLTSKKSDLMTFASKVGLFKKSEQSSEEPEKKEIKIEKSKKSKVTEQPSEPVSEKPVKGYPFKAKAPEPLPAVLKKPTEKKKAEAPKETPKAKSGFAAFMASNKGKGLTMKEMSEMYRSQKD